MVKKLKVKSEFSRNVLTLMMGTTLAQSIPVAISPILTRIYTPEDFGILAIFSAITLIFGSIANGRYELAIMLPTKEEDAINIAALGIIITSALAVSLFFVVLFLNDTIIDLLNNKNIGLWLYFIPLSVFFIGFFNVLSFFNNRKKNFKTIASASVIKSLVSAVVQLTLGLFKTLASGLITGQILSQLSANIMLSKNVFFKKTIVASISKNKIKAMAKEYINFPKYSMPAILLNTLSVQATNIIIPVIYDVITLGFFSLVQRILGMPLVLVSNAFTQVYFKEAVKERQETGKVVKSTKSTFRKLLLLGSPLFIFLYFFIESIFCFFFGESWLIAGYYAKLILPLFFIRFLVSTFTLLPIIYNETKIDLLFQLGMAIIVLLVLVVSNYFQFQFNKLLFWYMILLISYYLVYSFFLFFKYIKKNHNENSNNNRC
ncbi:MAG: O-antigen/teichoic acid export membrane protein [Polaribacter sp.]